MRSEPTPAARGAGAPGRLGVRLRAARATDLTAVGLIERASFSDPWSESSFTSLIGGADCFFAVATLPGGSVVGYVVAWFAADQGDVANIAVAPEARGRGVGAALLDRALEAAADAGVRELFLEVRESNAGARALYASRGFQEIGRRRSYYRRPVEDALVLRAQLAPHPAGG